MAIPSLALMQEIKTWPIEAREDDTHRYFFHFAEVNELENGKKNFVIGRKGTGKTAISEYIYLQEKPKKFAQKLSFKNFPFNSLYQHKDGNYVRPNEYLSVWKYVIACCICRLLLQNDQISYDCRKSLSEAFDVDLETALARSISKITDRSFSLNFMGTGVGIGDKKTQQFGSLSWDEKNDGLLKFIKSNIDDSVYYVIFDELDEDYRAVLQTGQHSQYFELLIGLFKACQDLRRELGTAIQVRPLVFLRSDIYDLIQDPDKNKWRDRAIELDWDSTSLGNLLAYRISRAADPNGTVLSFGNALPLIFSRPDIRVGTKRKRNQEVYKYLLSHTFLRPRDFVSFIRECAELAANQKLSLITPGIIRVAEKQYSEYVRREIVDEVHSIVEDIDDVLDLVANIRKQLFKGQEFLGAFESYKMTNSGKKNPLTGQEMLELLYHFNVLGNYTRGGARTFSYTANRSRLNNSELLCVHPSLIKAFQII